MNRLRRILKILLAFLPSALPTGRTAFNKWASDIIEITGPLADEDSLRWALAAQIQHSGNGLVDAFPPKIKFVASLRKAAANQIAGGIFHEIKTAQAERAAAEQAAQQTPAPTETDAGSDGQKV